MKLGNTFWFRHFLVCNELANKTLYLTRGIGFVNFAALYLELSNRNYREHHVMSFFWFVDSFFCDLHESEKFLVFEELEDLILILANLTEQEFEVYYLEYCVGHVVAI